MTKLVHTTTVPQTLGFLHGQLDALRAAGCDVRVITSPPEGRPPPSATTSGIPVEYVAMRRSISPLHDAAALVRLVANLLRNRPDILHAHTPKAGLLATLAARLAGVPIRVYHLHGLRFETTTGWRRRLLVAAEGWACRLATRVLCVSPSVRCRAIEEGVVSGDRIRVVGDGSIDGVDAAERFNPGRYSELDRQAIRRELGLGDQGPVIGFVGRLARDKGIKELADAWRTLRTRFRDARLLVVGESEPQDPLPRVVLESFEEDDRVVMTGRVDDPTRHYAVMDVHCLPSYREGLPYAPLEAAAMATAVVATRVTGCVDAVIDGETGTLVAPRDAAALAEAISRYLGDPQLRRDHGEAGRRRVLKDFAPELLRKETLAEYRRLALAAGVELPSAALSPVDADAAAA